MLPKFEVLFPRPLPTLSRNEKSRLVFYTYRISSWKKYRVRQLLALSGFKVPYVVVGLDVQSQLE
jgi:hypothetical protein